MNREEVLEAAAKIVSTDRNREYGEPENVFSLIAELWSAYLFPERDAALNAADVAALMILMKVARIRNNWRHEDSWVDIAGYAACGAECANGGS